MRRIILIIILAGALLYVNFPKTYYELEGNATECDCIGISHESGTKRLCYGLVTSCRPIDDPERILFENHRQDFCGEITCSSVTEYLGIDMPAYRKASENPTGVDLLLVIDTSFSMEGKSIQDTTDAAIRLIEELTPNDYSAVITFNNKANAIHDFSKDKQSVIDSISGIEVREDTRYTPALSLAQSLFDEHNTANKDMIIFLSDGDPLDDPDKIMNLSTQLKDKGIEIYTVRFGEKTSAFGEDILNRISSPLKDSEQKGFFVTDEGEDLYRSFKIIYESASEKESIFLAYPVNYKSVYEDGQRVVMDFEILSTLTEGTIPGYSDDSGISCIGNADVVAVIADKAGESMELPLTYSQGSYYGETQELDAGNYTVFLNITYGLENDSGCTFRDYIRFGTLNITESPEAACEDVGCPRVEALIKDMTRISTNRFAYDESSRKEMLVAVDTSSSMRADRLESVKGSLDFMIDLYLKRMDVGLIGFSDTALYMQKITPDPGFLKMKLNSLGVSGTTRYSPVFDKAGYIFSGPGEGRYLLLVSDGIAWDEADPQEILGKAEELGDRGVCIYTLGIGRSALENSILPDIAEAAGCGGFFHAFEPELNERLRDIYQHIKGKNGGLDIMLNVKDRVTQAGKPITIDARVFSEFNGFELPSEVEDGAECLPEASVNVSITKGREKVLEEKLDYNPTYGYTTSVKLMDPGTYRLEVDALATDGTSGCDSKGSVDMEIIVGQGDEITSYAYLLLIMDAVILAFIFYLVMGKD